MQLAQRDPADLGQQVYRRQDIAAILDQIVQQRYDASCAAPAATDDEQRLPPVLEDLTGIERQSSPQLPRDPGSGGSGQPGLRRMLSRMRRMLQTAAAPPWDVGRPDVSRPDSPALDLMRPRPWHSDGVRVGEGNERRRQHLHGAGPGGLAASATPSAPGAPGLVVPDVAVPRPATLSAPPSGGTISTQRSKQLKPSTSSTANPTSGTGSSGQGGGRGGA